MAGLRVTKTHAHEFSLDVSPNCFPEHKGESPERL
jgi:hypothetical protein